MRNMITVAGACAILAGCLTPPKAPEEPRHYMESSFNEEQARHALRPGNNVVKGSAFMRQAGGGVVTCAGSPVFLTPMTEYANERFRVLYQNGSFAPILPKISFIPDKPAYWELVHSTKCDAQGNFLFERVADGDYYLTTAVAWQVGRSAQGGYLMERVSLSGGTTRSVILSR